MRLNINTMLFRAEASPLQDIFLWKTTCCVLNPRRIKPVWQLFLPIPIPSRQASKDPRCTSLRQATAPWPQISPLLLPGPTAAPKMTPAKISAGQTLKAPKLSLSQKTTEDASQAISLLQLLVSCLLSLAVLLSFHRRNAHLRNPLTPAQVPHLNNLAERCATVSLYQKRAFRLGYYPEI